MTTPIRVVSPVVRRGRAMAQTWVRFPYSASMDTNQKGDVAEANVVAKFVELGYIVSEPVNDHARYDLIVDDGNLHRVQVKYAGLDDEGSINVSISSSNPNTSTSVESVYSPDEVDAFAIYCPDTGDVYWVDYEDAPKHKMKLRLRSKIENPNINWAEDYKL